MNGGKNMNIEMRNRKATILTQIQEGDVFALENGNLLVIIKIYEDGHYDDVIIDPEEWAYTRGTGDFNNAVQNNNIAYKVGDDL